MPEPVVLLLDIDGVINAFSKPGWGAPPRKVQIGDCVVCWAPQLIRELYALQVQGLIEMRWSTTWCGQELDLQVLERILRLHLPRAFTNRPPHKTWGDLKAEAALDALDESRYVAWADDMEVAGAWYLFPRFREEQERGRILPLTPVSARGLQPEDVAAIERFAREAQQAGIPD